MCIETIRFRIACGAMTALAVGLRRSVLLLVMAVVAVGLLCSVLLLMIAVVAVGLGRGRKPMLVHMTYIANDLFYF